MAGLDTPCPLFNLFVAMIQEFFMDPLSLCFACILLSIFLGIPTFLRRFSPTVNHNVGRVVHRKSTFEIIREIVQAAGFAIYRGARCTVHILVLIVATISEWIITSMSIVGVTVKDKPVLIRIPFSSVSALQ
jgi:hypothetical protein